MYSPPRSSASRIDALSSLKFSRSVFLSPIRPRLRVHRSRDRYPASPAPPAAVSLVGRRQHDFPGQRPPAHVAVVVIDVVSRSTTTLADQRLHRAGLAFLPRVLAVKRAAWERGARPRCAGSSGAGRTHETGGSGACGSNG